MKTDARTPQDALTALSRDLTVHAGVIRVKAKSIAIFLAAVLSPLTATHAAPPAIYGDNLLWSACLGNEICTVDVLTHEVTRQVELGYTKESISDLAFDRKNGLLYGISGYPKYPQMLFSVDLKAPTLEATLLGEVEAPRTGGWDAPGLAFVNGKLWAVANMYRRPDMLFSIDLDTLQAKNAFPLPAQMVAVTDIASDRQGGIFVMDIQAGGNGNSMIFHMAVPSGAIVSSGIPSGLGQTRMVPMAYDQHAGRLYSFDSQHGQVVDIDPSTFEARNLFAPPYFLSSMEFVSSIPEPSTALLLAGGLGVGLSAIRLRRELRKRTQRR